MLKRIVHPSARLVTFATLLHLNLSKPQRKHLLHTVDGVIVCEGRKTLVNLYRQWMEAPDASAVADFFRVSPWEAEEICRALRAFAIADMVGRAELVAPQVAPDFTPGHAHATALPLLWSR